MNDFFGLAAAVILTACTVTLCTGCGLLSAPRAAADVQKACTAPLAALDVEYALELQLACERSLTACEATKDEYRARYDAVAEECAK